MVERLLNRVEAGADIDRFLVITYTKAAAAELRGRVVAELADRAAARPGDAFLRRQTTLVYQAQISTIDAFCAQFLREEGYRLELDPDFRLSDENEAQMLMEDVLQEVLEQRYETIEPGGDFAFLVDTMSAGRDDSRLMQIVLDIRGRIQSHPDPAAWLDRQERSFALEGVTDAGATPWGALLLEDARRQADYWAERMEELLDLAGGDDKLRECYAPSLEVTRRELLDLSRAAGEGWDAAALCAEIDFPRLKTVRNCGDPAAQERIKTLRDHCKKRMGKLAELFSDDSAGLLADMRAVYPAIRGLFALVRDFEAAYTAEKNRRGVLDFSDLEHMTARLLTGADGRPTEIALRWGERFDEVMVDEYQDTNAVQNTIFDALTRGGRNLFMVGDVKQSIYRFRLADPTIFLSKYRSYRPWDEAAEGEPRRVLLSRNFRSRPQVLEGCNDFFRSVMSETFGEMDYTSAEALIPGGTFHPGREEDYRVELNALDCSAGSDDGGEKAPRDLLEARFAARRIRRMLDEGFPVSDGEGGLRPVRPGDIVILLRSPGTVLRHYAGALGELDVPWTAEGAEDFFGAAEIQVALSLLRIVDNPRQDVPLIAVLRSAVYAFSADRLAEIRAAAPGEDFYTALRADEGEDSRAFLSELDALRRQAEDESCDQFLWQLYDRTNLLGIYGAMDEGEKRRGNLLTLARLAREFESSGHKGLFGFLRSLQRLEESGRLTLSGAVGSEGGVRIMSIHKSKGLEFPVVLLCGLARQLNRTDLQRPILFHPDLGVGPKRLDLDRMVEYPTLARMAVARQMDRELAAEELRLLYVAMTRAQEKLILTCALAGGREELEKLLPFAGAPVEPQALLDCRSPAQWVLLSVLARPEAEALRGGGFPPPAAAGFSFGPEWDLRWEDAAPYQEVPRRPAPAAGEREAGGPDPEELSARFAWTYPHAGDVDLPSKLTATQLKGRTLDDEAAEETPRPARPFRFDRPRFAAGKLGLTPAQKGTALHLVMQYIDFDRCGSREGIAAEIARLVEEEFLTKEQGEAVDPARICAFFASDLGREVRSAPTLRREFKFSILVPAGRYYSRAGAGEQVLLQGVVDCFFETEEGLTVVDFKTDRVRGEALLARAEEYRPQITAYAQALTEITGRPAARRVLWFFSEDRAVEL
ncbi:MAG: helicase-exonuclease AddAB subunit AddA [Clostridiales bacterium]|nr:helicase-exonuclease AddAB subunit AddA [Clostridiales bacterium]